MNAALATSVLTLVCLVTTAQAQDDDSLADRESAIEMQGALSGSTEALYEALALVEAAGDAEATSIVKSLIERAGQADKTLADLTPTRAPDGVVYRDARGRQVFTTWAPSDDSRGVSFVRDGLAYEAQAWLPSASDELLVGAVGGDPAQGWVSGSVLGVSLAVKPTAAGESAGAPIRRAFRSRTRHHLVFKDRDGEGAISLRVTPGSTVAFDGKAGVLEVVDATGQHTMGVDLTTLTIDAETDTDEALVASQFAIRTVCVRAGCDAIEVEARTDIHWQSGESAKYKSGGATTVKGSTIDLNP